MFGKAYRLRSQAMPAAVHSAADRSDCPGSTEKACRSPLCLIERLDLLRALTDASKDWIPGRVFLVSQGEIQAIRQPLRLMVKDVLLHSGTPEKVLR